MGPSGSLFISYNDRNLHWPRARVLLFAESKMVVCFFVVGEFGCVCASVNGILLAEGQINYSACCLFSIAIGIVKREQLSTRQRQWQLRVPISCAICARDHYDCALGAKQLAIILLVCAPKRHYNWASLDKIKLACVTLQTCARAHQSLKQSGRALLPIPVNQVTTNHLPINCDACSKLRNNNADH